MAITNDAILNKMLHEIQHAIDKQDADIMKRHIASVRLLCDLILDEPFDANKVIEKRVITDAEKIKMNISKKGKTYEKVDHENANGDSIFDF